MPRVGVDVASVMEELRIVARRDGRGRTDMPFARMLDINYRSFRRWGACTSSSSRSTCSGVRGPCSTR